jgi:predicted alpha/beta hydrolase family esterase
MAERFYIFVNGIRASTEDLEGWHFRAERWVETHTDSPADTCQYHVFALTRWFEQPRLVTKLARFVNEVYDDAFRAGRTLELVLVGHSNGCAVICDAIRKYRLQVQEVHLIAAAAEASFQKNGLNDALLTGRVRHAYVYYDPQDPALKLARWTHWIKLLRYGFLGLIGPKYVDRRCWNRHSCLCRPGWGHSGYFIAGPRFEALMRFITKTDNTCSCDPSVMPWCDGCRPFVAVK